MRRRTDKNPVERRAVGAGEPDGKPPSFLRQPKVAVEEAAGDSPDGEEQRATVAGWRGRRRGQVFAVLITAAVDKLQEPA